MGVPGLQSWLKRRYPGAFVPLPADFCCDHLYLDISSTLHQVIRKSYTKQDFHQALHRRLDDILAKAKPRQRVVLALDGPAPLAKLLEQRRRRRRESDKSQRNAAADAAAAEAAEASSSSSSSSSSDDETSGIAEAEASQGPLLRQRLRDPQLSTLGLTTGTLLMLEVHSSLKAYICKKLAHPTTSHLSFELSDSRVKGEGELKILSRLLHPTTSSAGSDSNGSSQQRDATHLVIGADSDLLLMALVAGQRSVYILPDLPEEQHQKRSRGWQQAPAGVPETAPQSADEPAWRYNSAAKGTARRRTSQLVVFSRDAAEQLWLEQHLSGGGGSNGGQADPEQQREVTTLALDLLLLALMCSGDDYLPAVQGAQLSNKNRPGLWDLYTSMRLEPQWQGQCLVLRTPPDDGANCSTNGGGDGGGDGGGGRPPRYVNMDPPTASSSGSGSGGSVDGSGAVAWDRRDVAAAAALASRLPADDSLAAAAVNGGSGRRNITMRSLDAQPESYMEGLEWVLGMYCSGAVHDYRFTYELAAPSLPQLLLALEAPRQATWNAGAVGVGAAAGDGGSRSLQPLPPAACAMALLPRGGRLHAATALRHLMDEGSELDEIYATCDTCLGLGQQLSNLGRDLATTRARLAVTELQLAAAKAEASAAPRGGGKAAVAALEAVLEGQDEEVARLRVLLSQVSRIQQEHLNDVHPYKPFPLEQLEAAVAAVPLESYPRQERLLAQFGREFVYSRAPEMGPGAPARDGPAAAAAAKPAGSVWRLERLLPEPAAGTGAEAAPAAAGGALATAQKEGDAVGGSSNGNGYGTGSGSGSSGGNGGSELQPGQPADVAALPPLPAPYVAIQPWLKDCLSFAAMYPRVADPFLIRRSNSRVMRGKLPPRPYMQPNPAQRAPPAASATAARRPSAAASPGLAARGDWQQRGSRRTSSSSGVRSRHPAHPTLHPSQRSPLHSLAGGRCGRGAGRSAAAMLQGCTRLLSTLPRMLRLSDRRSNQHNCERQRQRHQHRQCMLRREGLEGARSRVRQQLMGQVPGSPGSSQLLRCRLSCTTSAAWLAMPAVTGCVGAASAAARNRSSAVAAAAAQPAVKLRRSWRNIRQPGQDVKRQASLNAATATAAALNVWVDDKQQAAVSQLHAVCCAASSQLQQQRLLLKGQTGWVEQQAAADVHVCRQLLQCGLQVCRRKRFNVQRVPVFLRLLCWKQGAVQTQGAAAQLGMWRGRLCRREMGLEWPSFTASSMLDAGMLDEGANATGSEPIDCAAPFPDIATMLAVVSAPVSSVRAKATQTKSCNRVGRALCAPIRSKAASRVYSTPPALSTVDGPYSLKRQAQNATKGRILFHGVHHVALLCKSLERSLDFYCGVLGLEVNPDRPHDKLPYAGAWLWIGPEMIHLMELPNPDPQEGRPKHGGRDRHTCIGVEDIEPLEARLKEAGVDYTRSMSGRPAIFFRDPDANCLEVVQLAPWR
ncbi:5'-3' exoribonuclease 2 [Chlorella vulgaris]